MSAECRSLNLGRAIVRPHRHVFKAVGVSSKMQFLSPVCPCNMRKKRESKYLQMCNFVFCRMSGAIVYMGLCQKMLCICFGKWLQSPSRKDGHVPYSMHMFMAYDHVATMALWHVVQVDNLDLQSFWFKVLNNCKSKFPPDHIWQIQWHVKRKARVGQETHLVRIAPMRDRHLGMTTFSATCIRPRRNMRIGRVAHERHGMTWHCTQWGANIFERPLPGCVRTLRDKSQNNCVSCDVSHARKP